MNKQRGVFLLFVLCLMQVVTNGQTSKNNLIYVDGKGVIRYTADNREAAFFGVNYTVPFAYGYRSHNVLSVDQKKAIDNDVYHFSLLGLDAFRVHVWDTEISDSAGNLLNNIHLQLFDYLLAKLKERNIRVLITPIAFWGNGYPEKDVSIGSFSSIYGKRNALVNDTAIAAQENYLTQFFKHINTYTGVTYGNDANVVAMEINNEPHHSGPKEKTTAYVNRMTKAVRSTGWTKPVFYNISESPTYADAVAKANVNGHSFQWYPTGLVANHTLQGNFLPNVDLYKIPFGDTIPGYRNRARMVYEFDAADLLQSNMYPAMARSFRTAGFQWATQFAYDPMATAFANTEYQTHYLNLAYTPSKAISLLIASKVFHLVPRLKSYGTYPADSAFHVFRVSYKNALSEMNADDAFYYSNTTATQPKNVATLQHIAGVGSSPVIQYQGYGAYFLNKLGNGSWRLEVMPDAIHNRDPFEKASLSKVVTTIQWQQHNMQIILPDLGNNFKITALNSGNTYSTTAIESRFSISPGSYLVTTATANPALQPSAVDNSFVAPAATRTNTTLVHTPFAEVTGGKPFTIHAFLVGAHKADNVTVQMKNLNNSWKTLQAQNEESNLSFEVPADMVVPGVLSYRIIVQKQDGTFHIFPGDHQADPYAWDALPTPEYETVVAGPGSHLSLFDATTDRDNLLLYNPAYQSNAFTYTAGVTAREQVLKASIQHPSANNMIGWQNYFATRLQGRTAELAATDTLVINARSTGNQVQLRVALISANAAAFATTITLSNTFKNYSIPLASLQTDSLLLLPRPYPGFLPLWFHANSTARLLINEVEKIECTFGNQKLPADIPVSVEMQGAWLK